MKLTKAEQDQVSHLIGQAYARVSISLDPTDDLSESILKDLRADLLALRIALGIANR